MHARRRYLRDGWRAPPDANITLNIAQAFYGRTVMGVIEGDSDPQVFIPFLVDKFMAGELPIDLLSSFYTLDQINDAVADANSGKTVKPVVRMP